MRSLDSVTIGDVGRAVARYHRYVATGTILILVVALLPGHDAVPAGGHEVATVEEYESSAGLEFTDAVAPETPSGDALATAQTSDSGGGRGSAARRHAEDARQPGSTPAAVPAGTAMVANCDPSTGRIAVPTVYAPPCVAQFTGDNGGETSRGVTKEKITLVLYTAPLDAATVALAAAAGLVVDPDAGKRTVRAMVAYFNAHYETYGREVELVIHESNGRDEQAQKADAIAIAEEKKAFAVINGGPGNVLAEELAARGVICIPCRSEGGDDSLYLDNAPFVWHSGPTMTQVFRSAGEYVGKRLWGRSARWAGDVALQGQERKVGIAYPAGSPEEASADAFVAEVQRYGGRVDERIGYAAESQRAAEQARVVIARFKTAGITTVAFAATGVQIAAFTSEASNQLYFPEWIPVVPLQQMNLVGRLADQRQWAHAFGPSTRAVPLPTELTEAYRLHQWHYGEPPEDRIYAELGYPMLRLFFDGVHMAGPTLNPSTFRDALWNLAPTGGGASSPHVSYGRHGLWAVDDYGGPDDFAEIWWDPNAQGDDETGRSGAGMYRYTDGGRRHFATRFPASEPTVFNPEGSIVAFDDYPDDERPRDYPSPAGG